MPASPGPHSGEDTYDLIDDALVKLAERRGAWDNQLASWSIA